MADSGEIWSDGVLDPDYERNALDTCGTIIGIYPDNQFKLLGNLTVIGFNPDWVLAVTVRHVLDEMHQVHNSGADLLSHLGPEHQFTTRNYNFTSRQIMTLFPQSRNNFGFEVGQCLCSRSLELAGIVLSPQPESDEPIMPRTFGIDLSLPKPGEPVWSIGREMEQLELASSEGNRFKMDFSSRFNIKAGYILDVYEDGLGIVPGHCFTTTIPFLPGESGRMVCRPNVGGPLGVLGVVSTDMSCPEAWEDKGVAGHSTVCSIWPLIGLTLRGRDAENGERRQIPVLDLVKGGAVTDISGNVESYFAEILNEEDGITSVQMGFRI